MPLWEATDEAGHFAYVKYLRDTGRLPYQPEPSQGLVLSHWFHPPLYYALGALTTGWIDVGDFEESARPNPHFEWVQGHAPGGWNVFLPVERAWPPRGAALAAYVLRLGSVAMGLGVVALTFLLARALVPGRRSVAFGAAALTAFNPAFVYMTAGVHNDNLAALLGSALLLWCARTARGTGGTGGLVVGGLLLGFALLAKTSALAFAPFVAAAAALGAARRAGGVRRSVFAAAVPLAVALAVAGWWYARNLVLYGDPLAWGRYMATHAFIVRSGPFDVDALRLFLAQLARTYWAAFGYMNLVVDRPVYAALWVGCAAAALGLLRVVLDRSARRALVGDAWPWLLVLGILVAYGVSLLRYAAALIGVGHGRLLFPVTAAVSVLLALGLRALLPGRVGGAPLGAAAAGLFVLTAAVPQLYVRPAYALPRPVDPAVVAAPAEGQAVLGGVLRLVGWRLAPAEVAPGERATLSLYWTAEPPGAPDLVAEVRLRDREGSTLVSAERRPTEARLPTDRWRPGDVYEDRYELAVPAHAYAGASPIEVGVRPRAGELLPPVGGGETRDGRLVVARLAIRGAAAPTPIGERTSVGALFGDRIRLEAFALESPRVSPGGTLRLSLEWSAAEPVAENYTVFVHLAGADGRPVAQADGEPVGGGRPTSVWDVGEAVHDPRVVPVPADAAPGEYRLLVGVYLQRTGQRLTVHGSGPGGPDFVELARVRVVG